MIINNIKIQEHVHQLAWGLVYSALIRNAFDNDTTRFEKRDDFDSNVSILPRMSFQEFILTEAEY